MNVARITAACAILGMGCFVVDRIAGALFIVDGCYRGRAVPPFSVLDQATREDLEVAVRVLRNGDTEGRQRCFRAFDAELGWTNRHGRYKRKSFNSIGARGRREYPSTAPDHALRIVHYGESFTYSSSVPDRFAWAAVMEREEPNVESINMGVGAYGTDQALLRFRRRGSFGARGMTIGLMVENIGRNVNRYRPLFQAGEKHPLAKPRFRLHEGRLELVPMPYTSRLELLEAALDGSVVGDVAPHEYWSTDRPFPPWSCLSAMFGALSSFEKRHHSTLWSQTEAEPFQVTVALLEAFYEEALASGVEAAVVLVFCGPRDVKKLARGRQRSWATLLAELDRRGIPYIDLADSLVPASTEEPFYEGSHLNVAGNAVVAERVLEWCRAHKWLD